MAKKSKFGADTVLERHLKQSAVLAHGGGEYFIPKDDFYDGSLSPLLDSLDIDNALNVDGDVTLGSDLYLPNAANVYFRNVADSANISALTVDSSDHTIIDSFTGKDIQFAENGTVKMRLQGGKLGIGVSSVTDDLEVSGYASFDRIGLGKSPSQMIDMQAESSLCPIYMTAITSGSVWQAAQILSKRARGTVGSLAACIDTDVLWRHDIYEYDGSGYILAAHLRVFADGAPTDIGDIVPCYYQITVTDSSGAQTCWYRFKGEGAVFNKGVLWLKEDTTPTAKSGYGAIYPKNDDKLYFQDGSGTEHEIAFATT